MIKSGRPVDAMAFGQFNGSGRMAGCYVYMLFCQDGGPVYVKIGISTNPTERLASLRTTCAVTPRLFASAEVRSKGVALGIERALHKHFVHAQTVGEWFVFAQAEAVLFRERTREVLKPFDTDPTRPLKWNSVAVAGFIKLAKKRGGISMDPKATRLHKLKNRAAFRYSGSDSK